MPVILCPMHKGKYIGSLMNGKSNFHSGMELDQANWQIKSLFGVGSLRAGYIIAIIHFGRKAGIAEAKMVARNADFLLTDIRLTHCGSCLITHLMIINSYNSFSFAPY